VKIAVASIDQLWEQKQGNLQLCRSAAQRAAALGARLVVFPEMTLTGFTMNASSIVEPAHESPTIESMATMARELRVALAFGVVLHGDTRPENTLVVVDEAGSEVARYAKIHPFSHADEHNHYAGGERAVHARVADVVFGLTICYDLRFAELYNALAPSCEAIIVIANWPSARIAHWRALLMARAIDCQCYVVGVNRTGEDGNGIAYTASSCVVDPRGTVLAPDEADGDVAVFTLDPAAVAAYRREFPTLQDRRPGVYRELLR
jgi:predicted amidohydrolase